MSTSNKKDRGNDIRIEKHNLSGDKEHDEPGKTATGTTCALSNTKKSKRPLRLRTKTNLTIDADSVANNSIHVSPLLSVSGLEIVNTSTKSADDDSLVPWWVYELPPPGHLGVHDISVSKSSPDRKVNGKRRTRTDNLDLDNEATYSPSQKRKLGMHISDVTTTSSPSVKDDSISFHDTSFRVRNKDFGSSRSNFIESMPKISFSDSSRSKKDSTLSA